MHTAVCSVWSEQQHFVHSAAHENLWMVLHLIYKDLLRFIMSSWPFSAEFIMWPKYYSCLYTATGRLGPTTTVRNGSCSNVSDYQQFVASKWSGRTPQYALLHKLWKVPIKAKWHSLHYITVSITLLQHNANMVQHKDDERLPFILKNKINALLDWLNWLAWFSNHGQSKLVLQPWYILGTLWQQ